MEQVKSQDRPIWLVTLFAWWRWFAYFAVALLFWFTLKWVGLISTDLYNSSVYLSAVALFFFAMPISLIFRLDHLANQLSSQSSVVLQFIALLYVGVNFTFLGIIQGYFRQWKAKRGQPKQAEPIRTGPSELNGKHHHSE